VKKRLIARIAEEKQRKQEEDLSGKRVDRTPHQSKPSEAASKALDSTKENSKAVGHSSLKEGMTAEEAELARRARLAIADGQIETNASEKPESLEEKASSGKHSNLKEGMTAEEAELVRKSRLALADNKMKAKSSKSKEDNETN